MGSGMVGYWKGGERMFEGELKTVGFFFATSEKE